jgi:hypothetical protein
MCYSLKKLSLFCLIVALFLCFAPAGALAAPAKDGYTLVPVLYGKTGVDVASQFILTTPEAFPLTELTASLYIEGQPMPEIAPRGAKEFIIMPAAVFAPNSLYIFRLKREGKADITWAFQTAKKFQITASYPHNEATNVPKNSGIEITFSSEGYTPIGSYFSISPPVEGKFEYHKNTAVFVPAALDYKTVYTVTLKAGVKLRETGEELPADYIFAFETEAAPGYESPQYPEYVYFYNRYVELPSIEAPNVSFRISHSPNAPLPDTRINVYKFASSAQALEAIKKITAAPGWARYAREEHVISTYGLNKIMSFDAKDYYTGDRNSLSLPDQLPQGFYLLDAALGNSRDQMIVQINDLPVQVIADNGQAIVWVNDISTGKASAGAKVHDVQENKTYRTDKNGVAVIGRPLAADMEQLVITATDGKTCIWLYPTYYSYYYYGGYGYGAGSADEAYWTALQLDRTLFKRDDSVFFFGFVQDRKNTEIIENVTAVLTQGYGYGSYGARDILQKQTVPLINGSYSDEMKLPNLATGSYNLSVYHGDIFLGSTYFTVRDYEKPPYKIDVSTDKKAVFAGETVTFTAKAGFFEGTPVADLDVSYRLSGYRLITDGNGQSKTDLNGEAAISQMIRPQEDAQGEIWLSYTVEATLPEIGMTTKYASARAFINDIYVYPQATRSGGNATLTVDVNSITLERINNGTAKHYLDYLDAPVGGKAIAAEVYRVYYEKVEYGRYYDYIEKKTVPRYRYNYKEEVIASFEMVTDGSGKAEKNFTVPDRINESYYAAITCIDGNGRKISHTVYIGPDYSAYWYNANSNDVYLDGAKESYDIGEQVNLTLKRGNATVTKGNFLYVNMQCGIQGYQAGNNSYSYKFSQADIPNVIVYAYYFNGLNYQSGYGMRANLRFDFAQNDLTLTALTDKESYKPGDMCSLTVSAKDKNGKPKEANVNISVVDEALFALSDYSVDTLTGLYSTLGSGLRFAAATHSAYMPSADMDSADPEAPTASLPMTDGGDGDDGTYLREVFKDTAFFSTVRTNARGEAVYSFKLPDNITSWRLTVSGISNDLYAGNSVQNIPVTSPLFLNYALNDEFLLGDVPVLGVNVYGASLSGVETVVYEVWDENSPATKFSASGAAFERVNIPLWEMKNAGANALIIKATVSNGMSDALKHQYQVLKSHREIDSAVYYDVTAATLFSTGKNGLTNITFTDRSRGAFLYQLLDLRYVYGDRIEKLLARREANRILEEYFPDLTLYNGKDSFDIQQYQRSDGGIAILPHAGSDLETTVKLLPYIKDSVNINSLKNYFYNIYEDENADNKMCALYGLAVLYEPVLLDLDNYALLDGLSLQETAYIALAYCALGESESASALYDSRIKPALEQITPYYRVNTGVDSDDILAATSVVNMLATKLAKPEKEGLYQYCLKNYTEDILINIEKLSHIEHEIAQRTEVSGSITYTLFGEKYTREFKNGGSYTLKIPAQNISAFKLLEVTGDVGAVSVFKKPLTESGGIDNDVTVRRRYYRANEYHNSSYTFAQGDLVRVQLWIDYSAKDIDGAYCVTDYLPSGLEYVSGSAKIGGAASFGYGYYRYCTVEGQKIMFYDYNNRFNRGYLYYYYARVISPGVFKAEGPLVQNLTAKDYFTLGEDSVVVIE